MTTHLGHLTTDETALRDDLLVYGYECTFQGYNNVSVYSPSQHIATIGNVVSQICYSHGYKHFVCAKITPANRIEIVFHKGDGTPLHL